MPDTVPTSSAAELASLLPRLRAYARFLARDVTVADDLVQEALLRALPALDGLRPGTQLRPWAFTILRNVFFESARRRRIEARVMAQAAAEDRVGAAQDGIAETHALDRLLGRLSPLLREALVLVGAQELSYEEAAEICGVPAGTVKARVSRARAQLAALAGASPSA